MLLDEAMAKVATEEYRKEHFEVDLAAVKITAIDAVEIDGESYPLTKGGQHSLCKLLEVPPRFYDKLNADDTELWQEMVQRIEDRKNHVVRFTVNSERSKKFIRSFNPASLPWIEDAEFLKMVGYVLEDRTQSGVKKELSNILFWKGGIQAQFMLPDTATDVMGKIQGKPDVFRLGFDMFNSDTVAFRSGARFALHRMVCTNRASREEKIAQWLGKHRGSAENLIHEFYKGINNLLQRNVSAETFIRERLGQMIGVSASLSELETADKIALNCVSGASEKVQDYERLIPIKSTLKKYNLTYPISHQKSDTWKKTASTPIQLYDLYNNLTWVASNSAKLNDEEKFEMQIRTGNVFFGKDPDLVDIAPPMNWN